MSRRTTSRWPFEDAMKRPLRPSCTDGANLSIQGTSLSSPFLPHPHSTPSLTTAAFDRNRTSAATHQGTHFGAAPTPFSPSRLPHAYTAVRIRTHAATRHESAQYLSQSRDHHRWSRDHHRWSANKPTSSSNSPSTPPSGPLIPAAWDSHVPPPRAARRPRCARCVREAVSLSLSLCEYIYIYIYIYL